MQEKDAAILELEDLISGGKPAFKAHPNKAAAKAFGVVRGAFISVVIYDSSPQNATAIFVSTIIYEPEKSNLLKLHFFQNISSTSKKNPVRQVPPVAPKTFPVHQKKNPVRQVPPVADEGAFPVGRCGEIKIAAADR
jgi:hypothetical protein